LDYILSIPDKNEDRLYLTKKMNMNLQQLLPELRKYKKIIVTGPQRSGTTIAAKIIAHELRYTEILEENFREDNLIAFISIIVQNNNCVIQAPALSSVVHLLRSNDIAVVFMNRPTEEILNSEKRVDWISKNDAIEKSKYFALSNPEPISTIKKKTWNIYQKKELRERAFDLEYSSLQTHQFWIDREFRKNFHSRQTTFNEGK